MSSIYYSEILEEIKNSLIASKKDVLSGLELCCSLLRGKINHYDWVGFYFSELATKNLQLKAFSGSPTEHTSIPFGKGICGQVATSNKPFMVPNVKEQDNYIACSINVHSELVVPLFYEEINIGQIDIDSDKLNSFSREDVLLLEACCNLISKTYGSSLLSL